jgi:NTE family protein
MDWARAQTGGAPLTLGGFLRLSGTPDNSLAGDTLAYGHVVVARQIGEFSSAVSATVRAGISLELGGAFAQSEKIHFGGFKQAGSAFLSVDTRFGPAFFGVGTTRGIGSSMYLFLGPIW